MTLFDCSVHSSGIVTAIGGGTDIHRRLVDLGLLGAEYCVRAKNLHTVLVDFGAVSAVIEKRTAAKIKVLERAKGQYENSAMRQSERRKDNTF